MNRLSLSLSLYAVLHVFLGEENEHCSHPVSPHCHSIYHLPPHTPTHTPHTAYSTRAHNLRMRKSLARNVQKGASVKGRTVFRLSLSFRDIGSQCRHVSRFDPTVCSRHPIHCRSAVGRSSRRCLRDPYPGTRDSPSLRPTLRDRPVRV